MSLTTNSELYRAVRVVIDRVPALSGDARPEALKEVAARLAGQGVAGAAPIANADAATLTQVRAKVLDDLYEAQKASPGVALTGEAKAAAKKKATALVSGGSYTGMLAAAAMVRAGHKVVLVEPRATPERDVRFGVRQAMIDTLALIDPELAQRVLKHAHKVDPKGQVLIERRGSTQTEKHYPALPDRAPDGAKAPKSGKELIRSNYSYIVVGRTLEDLIGEWLKEKYPTQIERLEGKTRPVKRDDGSVEWVVEKTDTKGATVDVPLPTGFKPEVVIAAEGSAGRTRAGLGIASHATTPVQYWTAGVIPTVDPTVTVPGSASMRMMYDEQPGATAAAPVESLRSFSMSDGVDGTWVLAQMPDSFKPTGAVPQDEINDFYFKRAALVTGQDEAELKQLGATGPFHREGSVPTTFPLQGKASREAARVLDDGTVVAFLGDSVLTTSFQSGGGMNTAISEVQDVMTLMEDLQSGVDPRQAVARFQDAIFERADAWSAAGIPYFFVPAPVVETRKLVDDHLAALRAWRKEGGDNPLQRMLKLIASRTKATGPTGMDLVA